MSGQHNLYLLHYTGAKWSTTYIATLSNEDAPTWYTDHNADKSRPNTARVTSQVSPNGRYLAFMSERPLTGFDNRDALSGQPTEEVFVYDALTARLACVSCDPTGARPIGVFDGPASELLVDQSHAWGGHEATAESGLPAISTGPHRLAGSLRSTLSTELQRQARYVSNDGRVFFDSPEALVPQDTNGLEDVYQYEPMGAGGCTTSSVHFHESIGGCVDLISSGQSSAESAFVAASKSGDDAFFVTTSRLTSADFDTSYDIYDAHACSASASCVATPVSPPPCTSGDSCKTAPSPQPEIFGPAPSATFSGVGNVVASSGPALKSKSLIRAQELARALRVCRSKTGRRKRSACERQARKRYAARPSRVTKATKRGNG